MARAQAAPLPLDVQSGMPFWAIRDGLFQVFPRLPGDRHCEVAVIGAGITGALVADELARHGHEVIVLDACDAGWGSTAASTALLQYECDVHLVELARRLGLQDALAVYRACASAIDTLQVRAREAGAVHFARSDSLYLASRAREVGELQAECALRRRHGLPARWLAADSVQSRYGLGAPGAILTSLAARVDPYRFALRLLQRVQAAGGGVFDHAPVQAMERRPRSVVLRTADGLVHARHVVVAAGYSSLRWLRRPVARLHSTYALATDPLEADYRGPWRRTLLWETARPYLYLRPTSDGRLLVGGLDDRQDHPGRRDARLATKAHRLLARARALLPALDLRPAFAWAGTFAETADGLPYFGPHPQYGPRVHFAMAYGGNGITYACVGAAILRAGIERRKHSLAPLLSFARR